MLKIWILLGTVYVVSGAYTYTRPSTAPAVPSPAVNRVQPSVLPSPPAIHHEFSHNVSFTITAKDLPSKALDTIDPYFKVFETSKTLGEPNQIGQTEVINDSPNAEFATVISYSWRKGTNQSLTLKLRDSDRLRDNDIGDAELDLDSFAAKGFKANLSLSTGGTILIQKTTPIKFKLYARNLPKMDPFGGKSDPLVYCYWRRGAKGEERKFFTTAYIKDMENPDWPEVIEFPNYIKGTDLWLVFKVRDSDDTGEDDLGETSLELDPYVEKRQTIILKLWKQDKSISTLGVTPVS